MAFFIFGLIGAAIAYYGLQAVIDVYHYVVSTDIIAGFISYWTTAHTLRIVPIEAFYSLLVLFFVALIIWIPLYLMLYDPHMFH